MFKFCIIQRFFFFLITFSFSALILQAQTRLQYKADELSGTETDQGPIREYIGNVEIIQDDIRITCNYARQIINTNIAVLKGNVIVHQGNMIMKSDEMNYDGNLKIAKSIRPLEIIDEGTYLRANRGTYFVTEKKADFIGNVLIENDTTIIISDQLIFYRDTDISLAKGNANIKSKTENVYLIGDLIENFPQKSYSIIKGNTNLFQVDTILEENKTILDTLKIVCDTIESFRKSPEIYLFKNNVKIKRNGIFAQSNFAQLNNSENTILFKDKPMIWYGEFQLYADSILVQASNKKLEYIKAYNNALSVNKDTLYENRFNQISGDNIAISFINGKLSKINSIGSSQSLYFINNEEKPEGADRKNTDNIEIIFNDGEAENIFWIGKTSGIYIPEGILFNSISKYNLKNLQWLDSIPLLRLREIKIKN